MNSRPRIQSFVEHELGCVNVEKWKSYGNKFSEFQVNEENLEKLKNLIIEDTSDIYFKAVISISEAIQSINKGFHSWAVVKLYYSVFYLLKCSLALKGFCFVKSSGIYTIRLSLGEKPVKRDGGKRNNEQIRGDHKTVIDTYIKEFGSGDFFLSNHIDEDTIVFDWIMKMREDVHYRNNTFYEPAEFIFSPELFKPGNLKTKIDEYFSNSAYCFLKEHCCLAVPLWLARRTAGELSLLLNPQDFGQPRIDTLNSLLEESEVNSVAAMRNIIFSD